MFRNRWGAMLFVALTLAGVTTLIGSEDGEGAIKQAAGRIAEQKAEADRLTTETQQPAPAATAPPETVILSADEDLIDPATGEDPTPIDEFNPIDPSDPDAEISDEVVIVSREGGGQPAQGQATSELPGE